MTQYHLHNQYCFISRRVWNDGGPIGYLYREPPDNERDSGWRIFAGDESDEYVNNPGNIAYLTLLAALQRDHSLMPLLDCPPPCAFARNEQGEFEAEAFAPLESE